MKILVYGAGVLGCNLARNLFRAGKDVTLFARETGRRKSNRTACGSRINSPSAHRSAILQRRSEKQCVKDSRNRRYENDPDNS